MWPTTRASVSPTQLPEHRRGKREVVGSIPAGAGLSVRAFVAMFGRSASFPVLLRIGFSSPVGRASAWKAGGRGFNPRLRWRMPSPLGRGAWSVGPGEHLQGLRAALRLGRVARGLQGGSYGRFVGLSPQEVKGGERPPSPSPCLFSSKCWPAPQRGWQPALGRKRQGKGEEEVSNLPQDAAVEP